MVPNQFHKIQCWWYFFIHFLRYSSCLTSSVIPRTSGYIRTARLVLQVVMANWDWLGTTGPWSTAVSFLDCPLPALAPTTWCYYRCCRLCKRVGLPHYSDSCHLGIPSVCSNGSAFHENSERSYWIWMQYWRARHLEQYIIMYTFTWKIIDYHIIVSELNHLRTQKTFHRIILLYLVEKARHFEIESEDAGDFLQRLSSWFPLGSIYSADDLLSCWVSMTLSVDWLRSWFRSRFTSLWIPWLLIHGVDVLHCHIMISSIGKHRCHRLYTGDPYPHCWFVWLFIQLAVVSVGCRVMTCWLL